MCTGSSGEFQSAEENLRIQADKLGMAPWAECLPCRHEDPHKSQQGGCGPNPSAAGQRQEGSVRDPVPGNTNRFKKRPKVGVLPEDTQGPLLASTTHMHVFAHMHTHRNVHIHALHIHSSKLPMGRFCKVSVHNRR